MARNKIKVHGIGYKLHKSFGSKEMVQFYVKRWLNANTKFRIVGYNLYTAQEVMK